MTDIQILGTASGVPTRSRNVSASVMRAPAGNSWVLVDCGEGTQHQLIKSQASIGKIDAILITHRHGDHCLGLPGLLASMSMGRRSRPLTIVAPKPVQHMVLETLEAIEAHLSFELIWLMPGSLHITPGIRVGGFTVQSKPLIHRVASWAYRFQGLDPQPKLDTEKLERDNIPRGPVWSDILKADSVTLENGRKIHCEDFRMNSQPPQRIIIAGDNQTPAVIDDLADQVQVMVHEATYLDRHADKAEAYGHSTASAVAQFAELKKVPNLVLTHFSARYSHRDFDVMLREVQSHYAGNVFLANDMDAYHLNGEYQLSLK